MPAFADNVTKVWKTHTVKVGFFTENILNIQGAGSALNGNIGSTGSPGSTTKNLITGNYIGSPNNPQPTS